MKINIKYIRIAILLMIMPLFINSCDSALDPSKDGTMDEKEIWKLADRAFGVLNGAYSNIPNGYNRIDGGMLAAGSDEAVHSDVASDVIGFNDGRWNQYILIDDAWSKNYEGLRKVNMYLENIDAVEITKTFNKTKEEQEQTRERMKGEAYFLRALFHFELVKRYGGIPLATKVLSLDDAKAMTRASMEACVKQITDDCDKAFNILPESYGVAPIVLGYNDANNIGRPTKWTAMALKSKALLYWASPLHNPNNDLNRWKAAADAADQVIKSGLYSLISLKPGETVGNIYMNISGSSFPQYHREILFSSNYFDSNAFEKSNTPPSFGGRGLTNPTHNLALAFGMANGKSTDDPTSGYDPQDPYQDRDPRFYMTIAHNGYQLAVNDRNLPLETYVGGKDALGQYNTSTKTGYYLNKMMSKNAIWDGRTVNVNRTWVILQISDILLIYAEAMNEYADAPSEDVYLSVEKIRYRAGLSPNHKFPRTKTKAEMRQIIRNERQVELAFAEERFFDVRRWKLFDDPTEREKLLSIKGMKIDKTGANTYNYSIYEVEKRKFEDKMYLFPIPQGETLRANIAQNPGW